PYVEVNSELVVVIGCHTFGQLRVDWAGDRVGVRGRGILAVAPKALECLGRGGDDPRRTLERFRRRLEQPLEGTRVPLDEGRRPSPNTRAPPNRRPRLLEGHSSASNERRAPPRRHSSASELTFRTT